MAVDTIAGLKAKMPANTPGGTTIADMYDFIDTVEDRTSQAVVAQTGTSYTAALTDNRRRITFDNAAAITFTIPNNVPVGWECLIMQLGAGQVSVTVTGGNLRSRDSHTRTAGQYAAGLSVVLRQCGHRSSDRFLRRYGSLMLSRAQVSARRRALSLSPISIALFSTALGDGVTSIDETAQTMSIAFGTTTTGRRALVPVVVGKRYRVSWVYSGTTGMQLYAGTTAGGLQYRPNIAGDLFFDFTATSTDLHLGFQRIAAGTVVSSLTIQEIPIVTWADTSLINPASWAVTGAVTVDQTTGAVTIPATGTTISARQGFPTTMGKLYRVQVEQQLVNILPDRYRKWRLSDEVRSRQ